jgi:CRP-like cAMP-binding protein
VRYECFVAGEASALLSEVPLFADLEPAELDLVAIAMDEVTFAPGTAVTVEGQPADGFFVVASGEADVTIQGERVATIKSGDYFGEIALLMGGERTATITATTELRCYGISPMDFRPLVEGNPTIAWKLMGSMTEHLS